MKAIQCIIDLLGELAEEERQEAIKNWDNNQRYANMYAAGKAQGYENAIHYLKAYLNNELPWED